VVVEESLVGGNVVGHGLEVGGKVAKLLSDALELIPYGATRPSRRLQLPFMSFWHGVPFVAWPLGLSTLTGCLQF
jgi:hypothetical protein